jgi:hypothetical protein
MPRPSVTYLRLYQSTRQESIGRKINLSPFRPFLTDMVKAVGVLGLRHNDVVIGEAKAVAISDDRVSQADLERDLLRDFASSTGCRP